MHTQPTNGFRTFLGILTLFFFASFANAQDIERFKPAVSDVEPAPGPAKITLPPEDEEGEISDEKVGEIKGIALVGHPDLAKPDSPPNVKGVEVLDENLLVPDGVTEALESYIDGPLSLKVVNDIARETVLAYRKAGLPVVDVAFPEQDVSTGVLQLVVVVATAGEITLKGNKFFKDDIYLRSFRLEPGDVIKADKVNGDLRYLNRSPYRNVGVVYSPGEEFGQTNLTLETEERRPYSAYIGYDDTGNELIGIDRMFFGLEWGNVFGLDHQAGYQYTTTTEFDGLHAHAASYRIPFAKTRHELILLAGYVESLAQIPAAGEILETGGQSTQLSGLYSIPMPDVFDYTTDLRFGFDFKSTNNNLEFGGAELIDSTAEIYQFSAGFQAVKRQDFGRQILQSKLVWSPGDLSSHNSDDDFQQLRGLGSADYFYWNGEFTQIVNLPKDFILVAEIEGQVSNNNLLPSETMVLGGVSSIRGFEQNITRADEGIRMSVELYAPAMQPLNKAGFGEFIDIEDENARLFGFYDYAWASNVDLLPGEANSLSLGGAGLGLEYRLARYLSLQIAYGWQVAQSGFDDDQTARWHVSTTARW